MKLCGGGGVVHCNCGARCPRCDIRSTPRLGPGRGEGREGDETIRAEICKEDRDIKGVRIIKERWVQIFHV